MSLSSFFFHCPQNGCSSGVTLQRTQDWQAHSAWQKPALGGAVMCYCSLRLLPHPAPWKILTETAMLPRSTSLHWGPQTPAAKGAGTATGSPGLEGSVGYCPKWNLISLGEDGGNSLSQPSIPEEFHSPQMGSGACYHPGAPGTGRRRGGMTLSFTVFKTEFRGGSIL